MRSNTTQFTGGSVSYDPVLENSIEFAVGLKMLPTKGNLVYEYNPFRNYRLSKTGYLYKNRLYTPKELLIELGVANEDTTDDECTKILEGYKKEWPAGLIPSTETDPVLVEAGELTDFETDELQFDLNHPVEILPQYSYDNSVNLIINDGKNKPRLINSRFSATARNKYQIVDRKGNNDTNIYDQGSQFDIDTSLYKRVIEIPKLKLIGVSEGGKMAVGNYHFYFRYADADGNETDFVAESGLVSLFVGSTPTSIRSGFREEDSHKLVRLLLSNIDSSYQYVYVYYTRASSDINENSTVSAYKINQKFLVNNLLNCEITVTGYEDVTEVSLEDINPMYQIADSVETQESCQNMLFLGNIQRPEIPYQELEDLSLRFLPYVCSEDYPVQIDQDYNIQSNSFGYYDPKFIYNKVGYWNHELYRFGIVYIMSDNSLSPVFNVRGIEKLGPTTKYSKIPMWKKDQSNVTIRNYIVSEEETYKIITENVSYGDNDLENSKENNDLENSKGVVSINMPPSDTQQIYSINFKVAHEVIDFIKNKLNIKGFFFVRQKRIPTILCQAYTIGVDKESNTPILPIEDSKYVAERFLTDDQILDNGFEERLYQFKNAAKIRTEAAICPEYDVDSPYYNTLFAGDSFSIAEADVQPQNPHLEQDGRNFYTHKDTIKGNPDNTYNVKIIGVEDNVKLVAINDTLFSARAGEAEEAFRYEYLEKENKITEASNLVRGSYGPYLGITGYAYSGKIIDIKIPGFNSITEEDLFKIRYADKSSFFAISERIDLKHIDEWFDLEPIRNENGDISEIEINFQNNLYRGDCYICQFTHRLNRNFQDPSAPINDKIVDPNCWKENYEVADNVVKKENFDKINLGDINAVKLGMWVTLTIRSTKNLNIRAIDDSVVDETALTGHPRGFYPYHPITAEGAYKTPEALCYNKGFEKSVSERWNYEVPDVPAIKNDFTNRISYSDVHVNDAFKNGFRVFQGTHYRDYPKTYGSITKLIELQGNLLCVFEHGIGLIPVNERAVAGEGSGGNVYINTANVLPENPKIISDTFGSQWRDSIIKTPRGVYGVDTVGKKIWRTNGETFECISDFRVQEFLNQNISLTERELEPVIGVRNVKSHYNKFKGDVMFTFYDNLYGFEEKVWNLCWNENLQKWMTFYSWVPSYSENIYNEYFSFDRNTSKWITKLGVSRHDNDFSDGVTLGDNVIESTGWKTTLHLSNRNIPKGEGIIHDVEYELVRDNYGNYKLFNDPVRTDQIDEETGLSIWEISLKPGVTYEQLCSEYYARVYNNCFLDDLSVDTDGNEVLTAPLITSPNTRINLPKGQRTIWQETLGTLKVYKNDRNRRINLVSKDKDKRVNGDKVVILLNINAKLKAAYIGEENVTLGEAYANGYNDRTFVDEGYYQSVVAVIPKYNMQFLTTDFWKHGQAGIIDIADKIYPTYWYGKQHPFEFEFVVADSPDRHKIFDSLEIISNKAAPESFHYEIVGECYDFAKYKKNMYIRQEATKELYQFNGSDIVFNPDYKDLISEHRPLTPGDPDPQHYDKSTIFPLYYRRQDTINEIEDFYHLYGHKDRYGKGDKNFSALAGAEIVRYENLDEYRIWNHAKAVDIKEHGLLRGNMYYKEDKWYAQINPINLVQKNETRQEWDNRYRRANEAQQYMVPAECNLFPPPADVLDGHGERGITLPDDWTRNVVSWSDYQKRNREAKIKDKFIKIRIRYSGEDLAIISAIRTLYSISYA